jgi:hypothetical protein
VRNCCKRQEHGCIDEYRFVMQDFFTYELVRNVYTMGKRSAGMLNI